MTEIKLTKLNKINRKGPLLLVVMDGIGLSKNREGNAVLNGYTPKLDELFQSKNFLSIKAHGTAVGLPSDDDMGNSEVGHNAIGAGRIFSQGAKLINRSIEEGELWKSDVWKNLIKNCLDKKSSLHFIGLFSDGNVHSHINHLKAMIEKAADDGVKSIRIHPLLDGRDVGETSALDYVEPFEEYLDSIDKKYDTDCKIASGGGRMFVTMDRYEADWSIVERGWKTHVLAKGRTFSSAKEAIETYRKEKPGIIDQDLPPFVIAEDGKPVGKMKDGDSVVFFNYRGDRAIEISRAFEEDNFDKFDRSPKPDVMYAGMMQYDGDAMIPKTYIVPPPSINKTFGEVFAEHQIQQFAISETQKFGHVTYFWNGNRSGKFSENCEEYVEITSDRIPFEQKPWMKAAEITERVIGELYSEKWDFLRLNFANGDMVGHTGIYQAAIIAVETVDMMLSRILKVIDETGGIAIITADHGNSDEMFEIDKKTGKPKVDKSSGRIKAKTSHTLNPVPFIIYDPKYNGEYEMNRSLDEPGLSNVAATCCNLLDYEKPEIYDESLIVFK